MGEIRGKNTRGKNIRGKNIRGKNIRGKNWNNNVLILWRTDSLEDNDHSLKDYYEELIPCKKIGKTTTIVICLKVNSLEESFSGGIILLLFEESYTHSLDES